jgi:ABC-type sugar transport system ATPase subunit
MVAGLEEVTGGEIRIGGRVVNDIAPRDRDVAMVFQNYALYPHMSVFENLAFGLKLRKVPREDIRRRVETAAGALGIERYLERRPRELSGGSASAWRWAGRWCASPRCSFSTSRCRTWTPSCASRCAPRSAAPRRVAATTIYVTHDQVEAMTMGDRIAVLNRGVLQQVADPHTLYARPANTFVAGFIGTPPVNLFEARAGADGTSVEVAGARWNLGEPQRAALAGRGGSAVTVGVRPEDLNVAEPGLPATLEVVEPLGARRCSTGSRPREATSRARPEAVHRRWARAQHSPPGPMACCCSSPRPAPPCSPPSPRPAASVAFAPRAARATAVRWPGLLVVLDDERREGRGQLAGAEQVPRAPRRTEPLLALAEGLVEQDAPGGE